MHFILAIRGQRILRQDRKEALVQPSDLTFYDTSRPSRIAAATDNGTVAGITVLVPRTLISLPAHKLKDLTATSSSGQEGIGALLTQFLNRLSSCAGQYRGSNAAHLANPVLATRPIHAIAERWGFASSAHFGRVFRTTYGIAPSDYRRLMFEQHAATA